MDREEGMCEKEGVGGKNKRGKEATEREQRTYMQFMPPSLKSLIHPHQSEVLDQCLMTLTITFFYIYRL